MSGPRSTAALLAGAFVLALSGCGLSGDDPAAAEGEQVLRVALADPEASLSVQDYTTSSFTVLDQLFEPLVRYQADGSFAPALAESFEISDDGLTMTFALRQGVTFTDGTPFDAEVARADLLRWVDDPDNGFLGLTGVTESIEATDEATITWRLSQPYYSALNELALTRPVRFTSPGAADGEPVGTGPYRLEQLDEQQIVLVRNDDWWGGEPSLDRVVFEVIPDAAARVAALQAGEVDVIGGDYTAPLALEDVPALQADDDVEVLTADSTTNLLLTVNADTGNPALADPAVRRAMALAVDRAGIAAGLFDGAATAATTVFPANVPYGPQPDDEVVTDPDAARALLDGAGWTGSGVRSKDGVPLQLTLVLDPGLLPQAVSLSQALADQLADVGIGVTIDSLDTTAYGARVSARDFDLRFYSTYGAPYDPYSTLTANFRTESDGHLFASPELDAQIPVALAATSDEARQAAFDDVWATLGEQVAAVPLVQLPRLWAASTDVRGFELGATEYDLPLTDVTVTR
ncbi:ABC transporter substrate-binding protein [Modestobacter versicolor]|uniref:Nickel ABC transporter substrate-binding protein n=1 Tax=Modestobacter versicolor TaxID=429133 RepID=A0A323V357_9ACTN|nr:ABC transporter substrate-binding protein [Modestobacter versicolor]MBB3674967.1 nickel transport system substrate-binding protein [Modestobacter versicolor]PZA19259.1 nickel ABC transporter substrate-binding protein [Modestobacter versicolor]